AERLRPGRVDRSLWDQLRIFRHDQRARGLRHILDHDLGARRRGDDLLRERLAEQVDLDLRWRHLILLAFEHDRHSILGLDRFDWGWRIFDAVEDAFDVERGAGWRDRKIELGGDAAGVSGSSKRKEEDRTPYGAEHADRIVGPRLGALQPTWPESLVRDWG